MQPAIANRLNRDPRKLTPENPELKKKLPHYTKPATTKACGDNEVNAVYPNALEICGINSSRKGMGIFMGLLLGFFSTSFLIVGSIITFQADVFGIFFILAAILFLIGTTQFIRMDLFAYRDEPVLLNRQTRKVHVFRVKRNWRRPFSNWPLAIDTFDWNCVHAEIGGGVVPGTVPLLRYRLYLAFTQNPTSKRVVDRFTLGYMSNLPGTITETWEHIRRYMEENGPPLQAKDRLRSDRHFSSRETWGEVFPYVMPNWQEEVAKHPILSVGCIVLFPIFFLFGFSAWISGITGRNPFWPKDILEAAGGAPLSEAEIEKLRTKSTETEPAPIEEDPTGGMKPRELAKYQKEVRERYAEMRDDELEDLAQNTTLLAPARKVLAKEMLKRGFAPPT